MAKPEKDMNELLLLKDAAAEVNLDHSYLWLRIKEGVLEADRFGGHVWWVKRSALYEFVANRSGPGPRVVEERPGETEQQRQRREYNRLKKQESRARPPEKTEPGRKKIKGKLD